MHWNEKCKDNNKACNGAIGALKAILKVFLIVAIEIILNLFIQGILWILLHLQGGYMEGVQSVDYYMTLYNTYIYIVIVIGATVVFFYLFKKEKIIWLKGKLNIVTILIALLSGAVPSLILNLHGIEGDGKLMPFVEAVIYIAFSVIITPFIEEIVYRDFLFKEIKKNTNIYAALIISSLVFSLMHMDYNQYIYTFVMGIVFSLLYDKKGCMVSIMAHVSFNLTAIIVPFIFF